MFDYDGVIVDSADAFTATFLAACRACGYGGISTPEQVIGLLEGNFFEELIKLGLSKSKINDILGAPFEREARKHIERIKSFDGISELLKSLSRQNVLVIITSNATHVVENQLNREKLTCFKDVLGMDKEKSKIKKIKHCMNQHPGIPAYYVGDTKGDMFEGKAAGSLTVAVTWGWHSEEKLLSASPDYIVHSPQELEALLSV